MTLRSATEGTGLLIGAGPRPNLAAHQTALLKHVQAWMPYGLVVPDVDSPAGMTAVRRPPAAGGLSLMTMVPSLCAAARVHVQASSTKAR